MPKFTQNLANYIFAACMTWAGLIAVNAIPDGPITHWISVAATGVQLYLVNLGFRRTPNGTIVPPYINEAVDEIHANDKPSPPPVV